MSYYESASPGPSWSNSRQSWDTRSNGSSNSSYQRQYVPEHPDANMRPSSAHSFTKPEELAAFGSQLDEVDRAVDNLLKSGKLFTPRRDSMPGLSTAPGPVPPVSQPRMGPSMPPRTYSAGSNYDDMMRSQPAASLQNFYANQRFAPRPSEAEQMLQAKRRQAAQRERDLRNYHQEQQYNRSMQYSRPSDQESQSTRKNAYRGPLALLAEMSPHAASAGKERVVSPGGMTEDDRRELIARQHRALYGDLGNPGEEGYPAEDAHTPRASGPSSAVASNAGSVTGGTRGSSPLAQFDPFGYQNQNGNSEGPVQPTNERVQAQSSRTSASSPGGSPPRGQLGRVSTTPVTAGVAPIGTRPVSTSQNLQQAQNPNLQKRSTTPLPSPLGYGFHNNNNNSSNQNSNGNDESFNKPMPNERSSSAASNHTSGSQDPINSGWGKVWGGNKNISNVASVWG